VPDVYCRNCGVRLRRFLFAWRHTSHLGPVACPNPEPDLPPEQSG
jgi:hypothetical protein